MADLFFGNKDKEVLEKLASSTFAGKLDYPWLITDEAEIPVTLIYDYDSIADFQAWLDTNQLSAPNLIKGLNIIFSQKDKNYNILKPNCGFVAVTGIVTAGLIEDDAFYSELESRLDTHTAPYYALGFISKTEKGMTWANTYPKKILPYFFKIDNLGILPEQKGFIRVHKDVDSNLNHIAEMGQFLFRKRFAGVKFMQLTGRPTYPAADSVVTSLDASGIAIYRLVNGHGEVSNSLTTNLRYIDERFIMDTVVYNLANALDLMFLENDVFDYNVSTLIRRYTENSLKYVAETLGMISLNEDQSYAYSIYIPPITGQVRSLRELSGIEWRFIQVTPIEKVSGTAVQALEQQELVITTQDLSKTTLKTSSLGVK